jgi:uncharacterized protein involved in type VI secretion and phage assembly
VSDRTYGVVIGVVCDLDDPEGQARVKVRYPWLTDEEHVHSSWAPIVRPMGGKGRGHFFMPEVEDEALIGFEHGDFSHPFILGFLHNGVDLPPDDDIDNKVRRIKTVSGHILEFDDREGQERVLLKTQGGQLLEMKDVPGSIDIKTTHGTTISMTDTPSKIVAKTTLGVTLEISETGVTVTSMSGPVTVNAMSCQVTASTLTVSSAAMTFNTGMATFSGVVSCQVLLATAVASSIYTPGLGNLI